MLTSEQRAQIAATFTPFRYSPEDPFITFDHIERAWFPQERHFMSEMIPHIHAIMRTLDMPVISVLDVGARCGQGSALLASLHPESDTWKKPALKLTAIEIEPYYQAIAVASCQEMDYIVGDVHALPGGKTWDIVIASHIVEHFENPYPFVNHLKSRSAGWLIVYTPYNEQALIPAHYLVDDAVIERMAPDYIGIIPSYGWRHPHDERSDCVLQIFDLRKDRFPIPIFPGVKTRSVGGHAIPTNKPLRVRENASSWIKSALLQFRRS